MKLIITRHGETLWNTQNRILGRTDIPLNENGFNQAKKLVKELSFTPLKAVYSSPLSRAYSTALMVAQNHNIACIKDHRLIEMDFGIYEGLNRNNEEYELEKQKFFCRYPNGESYFQVVARVYALLYELLERHPNDTILIVTHNGICRIVTSFFDDMSNSEFVSFVMGNCEVREFFA